ncbi:MAG TPA: hypothetical protein VKP64_13965 [Mycobacteriales bacterium]|nr:hypothetical protein [Mycobacteriales bacterium]
MISPTTGRDRPKDPDDEERMVSLWSKAMKLGIAKKVVDEARKPENQQRIKDMVASAKTKAQSKRRRSPADRP